MFVYTVVACRHIHVTENSMLIQILFLRVYRQLRNFLTGKCITFTVNSLIKAQGAGARKWPNRGHSQLPEAFYRMKIGPFLAEI